MSLYDTLNEQQREGVFTTEGPVLILAGAGSGKTSVLTRRIAHLIQDKGVMPWNILAITFTNKAAGEMKERVEKLVEHDGQQVWIATFHSTCVRILRRYIDRLGYDTSFTIYDTDDSKSVIKDVCKKLNIDTKMYKEKTLMSEISSAKDKLISPMEYQMSVIGDYRKSKIAEVYKEYQDTLKKNNALDFDDIIVKTVELFKSNPDVLESYQDRFRYIMVDEYQDTNMVQFELIRLLADRYRNLCVVGDDDQSIYKFRGADIRNILDFEFTYPDATVIKLEQNYRSTQNVLDAANAVISNNRGRKAKALWTDKGSGNRIHFRTFDKAYEESEYVAGDIRRKKRELICDYKDCAVLYRTNAQSRLMEESFVALNIPYKVVGGVNFYSRKEIKDILAYLKTIDNGKDDLSVKRIINVPRRGIGAASISKVQAYADENGISFFEALSCIDDIPGFGRGKAVDKLKDFATMIRAFRTKLQVCDLEELITDLLETTKYTEELEEDDDDEAQDRLQNIDEFITKMVSFQIEKENNDEEATLSAFLEEVALVADIDSVNADDNKVLLMTIHSAKGLEFSQVYLAGLEDGIFPSYMTIMSDDASEIEEERRLAYVGITRAKDDLTITYAKQRMIRGETQYNAVSRFVKEIPSELLDNKVPSAKRWDDSEYGAESYERNIFKTKPFQSAPATQVNRWAQAEALYNNPGAGSSDTRLSDTRLSDTKLSSTKLSDTVFDKPKNNWQTASTAANTRPVATTQTAVQSAARPVKDLSQIMTSRPKAVVKKKETPAANKPYIAKTLDGLTKGSAISSPEALGYTIGDRVYHIKYGEGSVLDIEAGPKDYKVTVDFDSAGNKIMYAAFAKLKRI